MMRLRRAFANSNMTREFLLVGALVALVVTSPGAAAETVAYASRFLGGGFDIVRLDLDGDAQKIGSNDMLPSAGAFAGNDYSTQYIVDWNIGRVESIDVRTGYVTGGGIADFGDNTPIGLHWDPTSGQMYAIANDEACTTTTLYAVSITNFATFEIGSTPRCIASLAIDAQGNGYGIDVTEDALVSINIGTGESTMIGPLSFHTSALVYGLDFDPSTGELDLFAYDDDAHTGGRYLVDTEQGTATRVTTYDFLFAPLGLALALQTDAVFFNGFDPK